MLALLLLWVFALSGIARNRGASSSPSVSIAPVERFAYLQFGVTADSVYLGSTRDPTKPKKAFDIPHAANWGAVGSLSPNGKSIAYNALPAATVNPTADSPADVWVAPLDGSTRPVKVAQGVDLLVRPTWSPDGRSLVLRKSTPQDGTAGDFELVAVDAATGEEHGLVSSSGLALFPVGYAPSGGSLYYVRLKPDGSELFALDPGKSDPRFVATLSDYLTRDWALSPDGQRLAYLALYQNGKTLSSKAMVIDLEKPSPTPAEVAPGDEFGPTWTADGVLTYGRLGAGAARLAADGSALPPLARPQRGFDVPLGWSEAGTVLAVRSFDGSSTLDPGSASLVLVDEHGARTNVSKEEVTFLGWTAP